uniref:ARM repeat-containing protein n=1 Tax=Heterorhabditis bacteriophora TaxID=37862 RepID=A0A1I7XPY2_HETBA
MPGTGSGCNILNITSFCSFVGEHLQSITENSALLEIVTAFDQLGNLDALTGSKLTEQLISRMDAETVAKWIASAETNWSLRRVCGVFSSWNIQAKTVALSKLIVRPNSDDIQYTTGNCIDSLFKIKVRAGDLVSIQLSEENEMALREIGENVVGKDVVKKGMKKMVDEGTKRPLSILWLCLKLWAFSTTDEDDRNLYESNANELFTIAKETVAGNETNMKVLIDLLMSLLSQPKKYHRSAVYFVFVNLLPMIKSNDITHIIDSLMLSDDELAGEGTSSDVEDAEEDSANDDEGEEALSDNENDIESDSDLDGAEEIDQDLVTRLQNALGKAAVKIKDGTTDEAEEGESDISEVDDDEMFAMDEQLSVAFKAIGPKKDSRIATQTVQAFRSKLADLLLFTLSSQETSPEIKLNLMIPLIRLAKVQLKRSSDASRVKKTIELLEIMAHLKKVSVPEKRILKLFPNLVAESIGVSNPSLNSVIASLASFLFSLGLSEGVASENVKKTFLDVFQQFMSQEDGTIGSELATAAILKYPAAFVSELPTLLESAFNGTYRIYRRTEAIMCAAALCHKQVMKSASVEKGTVKKLGKYCAEYLKTTIAAPETVKPRFFAGVLKFLSAFVPHISGDLMPLLSKLILPTIDSLTNNEEIWKGDLKKCNAACQQVCGRAPLHILNAIRKSLE